MALELKYETFDRYRQSNAVIKLSSRNFFNLPIRDGLAEKASRGWGKNAKEKGHSCQKFRKTRGHR